MAANKPLSKPGSETRSHFTTIALDVETGMLAISNPLIVCIPAE